MENTFLPQDYKQPDNSSYLKFKLGENTFRILSSAIVGFEYWTSDNKPVRSKEPFKTTPNIKVDKEGKTSIKHFWAMSVYNQDSNKIQVLEITQSSIQGAIKSLVDNAKWGDPTKYDITVTRVGDGFDTNYSTMPNPHSDISPEVLKEFESMNINLKELYAGGDPFKASVETKVEDNGIKPEYQFNTTQANFEPSGAYTEEVEPTDVNMSDIPF